MTDGKPELLAPAGNFETALSAFAAGADAVYCGLTDFSARAFADNFTEADLDQLLRYARKNGKKVYVTFNTTIEEDSIEEAISQLSRLAELRPDALIVQDIGVARICRRHFPELELHASTQMVAHNLEGVLALGEAGFRRVVLARELSLDEISSISRRCGNIELECFIHGALCYSVSGLCLFGAMEKGRSGNRGKCPYCCRMQYEREDGSKVLAFSMKDMRLGEDVSKLADVGVASLKIEGRMKSALYVSSVTKYYREILDQTRPRTISLADLETVFSRRTTELYLNGKPRESVIDETSLGHVGTEIGTIKRITRDREGLYWLRFHTSRALEKHDGLQFEAMVDGRHVGTGVNEMRQAISRHPVFEVNAGTDVEVLLSEETASQLKAGMKIYCSMSNAVKRRFHQPSFRPSDYEGDREVEVVLKLEASSITAVAKCGEVEVEASAKGEFAAAKNPEKTSEAARKAFAKMGDTAYRLGRIVVNDPERRFAPMSILNDLRRDLVERLDNALDKERVARLEKAVADDAFGGSTASETQLKTLRVRLGQKIPAGDWDEVIVLVGVGEGVPPSGSRLALPVYTAEAEFNHLRNLVKRYLREGFTKWEASDLATLRMLKSLGVTDIVADWTLYAFNSRALASLTELGIKRFVASPENSRENLQWLAESGYAIEFIAQQSTPLFVSLTEPMKQNEMCVFRLGALWVTTKFSPRTFELPAGVSKRIDLSWDPEC